MDAVISGIKSYVDGIDGSHLISILFEWQDETRGFGQMEIKQVTLDGNIYFYIDNELMSKEFVKKMLGSIVDKASLEM